MLSIVLKVIFVFSFFYRYCLVSTNFTLYCEIKVSKNKLKKRSKVLINSRKFKKAFRRHDGSSSWKFYFYYDLIFPSHFLRIPRLTATAEFYKRQGFSLDSIGC